MEFYFVGNEAMIEIDPNSTREAVDKTIKDMVIMGEDGTFLGFDMDKIGATLRE